MYAVLFEASPHAGQADAYFQRAADLRPRVERIDGFLSIERFASLTTEGRILSLSMWRDEAAIARWRADDAHRAAQAAGRAHIFADYRLRVARVVRDYSAAQREAAPSG